MDLPDLLANTEEGFADLSFRIVRWSETSTGERCATVAASFDGKALGLEVAVGPDWQPATLGDNIPVFWGSVTYRSIGEPSDHFIRALASVYGLTRCAAVMKPHIRFTAVALAGNPANCPPEPVRLKLFYESEAEAAYAEVYTNFDPANAVAGIREKDPDYRQPLFAAIAAVR